MNIGVVIQVRLGSSRFPDKVFHRFCDDSYLLKNTVEKFKNEFKELPLVIATTENEKDNKIYDWAKKKSIDVYRGSELNVLKRFYDLNTEYQFDYVLRVCCDNLFLSVEFIKEVIQQSLTGKYDYISHYLPNGLPTIKSHYGFFIESIKASALNKAYSKASTAIEKEHVTPFFYQNPSLFLVNKLTLPNFLNSYPICRCTFDDSNDFEILNILIHQLGKNATPLEILDYIEKNPEIGIKMNNQINKYSK